MADKPDFTNHTGDDYERMDNYMDLDDIVEKIVWMIFEGKVELVDPFVTILQIKTELLSQKE